ncbi:glycerol-3-phosphate dehydrogenase/oxidase [Mesonia sp.]|uniref:glycerol-3-phosphate dehydrogenase/oxidase n=1 Tax=Mesonia sp. TaxID=1960830 RepID=UPI001765FC31|nr:glycerol-3-phosphate dehydrogenase/oxidase [Mesonia sp.]HIB36607.1 glycerol-3-phosphate dehydrogenase/oxidase [Mesonia sp.]HIO27947.1 glycerol-3-phosphate dehydrogenase/oxidase [Flavobacteriaceae bacterium]
MSNQNIYSREAILNNIDPNENWDVIIIGGGATGLGTALDSVTRGYKTLLLEMADYAKGTSSRSTKLVHGGVRYLAQGNIDLVKEALHERGLLAKNAPHLVKNQSFIIPNYRWWEGMYYTIGLKVYDFLAGKLSLGKSKHIKTKETVNRIETLKKDKIKGGVVYQDGQFDDSRLAINVAQSCVEEGATLLNYFKVTGLTKDGNGNISGVKATDSETNIEYNFKGKTVVNATGIFTDEIIQMDNPEARKMVRPSQGVHLVFDKSFLPGNDAIMIPKTDDGRVLFAVPWHDKVIVGTTDTMLDEHSLEPQAQEQEIEFILKTFNKYISKQVSRDDVLSIFAGLRPLAAPKDNSEKSKEISRSHKIIVSNTGLVTITGGKWTTFRRMAQDTVNKIISLGKLPKMDCKTEHFALHGAQPMTSLENHLYIYGSDKEKIETLMQHEPALAEKLHSALPFTKAEVVWAARYEMARSIDDVLARRVRALFLNAKAAIESAPTVADILAKELNKTEDWKTQQIETFTKMAKHYTI